MKFYKMSISYFKIQIIQNPLDKQSGFQKVCATTVHCIMLCYDELLLYMYNVCHYNMVIIFCCLRANM